MIQHPIPQNVTTYQFRLIGDMTIQQFVYLAAGVGGAIFFYYTNLFFPIKWALVLFSALAGFAVAFLPLEDRPLDQWIANYIKAIYRPTRFMWKKTNSVPAYFTYTPSSSVLPGDAQELARAAAIRKQQGLRSFLVTLPEESQNTDSIESVSISNIMNLFNNSTAAPISPPIIPTITSSTNILVETPETTTKIHDNTVSPADTRPHQTADRAPTVAAAPVHVEKTDTLTHAETSTETTSSSQPNSNTLTTADLNNPAVNAITATNLPFPSTPTSPDTVVGMVLDIEGRIIDNAIIEVVDETGLPVRATKTNQLGQFFSTTPLKRGSYRIVVEKPGLIFDTIKLEVVGQIINPLKIQAKN